MQVSILKRWNERSSPPVSFLSLSFSGTFALIEGWDSLLFFLQMMCYHIKTNSPFTCPTLSEENCFSDAGTANQATFNTSQAQPRTIAAPWMTWLWSLFAVRKYLLLFFRLLIPFAEPNLLQTIPIDWIFQWVKSVCPRRFFYTRSFVRSLVREDQLPSFPLPFSVQLDNEEQTILHFDETFHLFGTMVIFLQSSLSLLSVFCWSW